jgi:hypothetical protein
MRGVNPGACAGDDRTRLTGPEQFMATRPPGATAHDLSSRSRANGWPPHVMMHLKYNV